MLVTYFEMKDTTEQITSGVGGGQLYETKSPPSLIVLERTPIFGSEKLGWIYKSEKPKNNASEIRLS